jgi:hypothetical protein
VYTDYFDGDALNGPVPRLFAPDPALAKVAISSDTGKAFKDVQRLHSRLFMAEHISADEAWGFVGNPRYRTQLKYKSSYFTVLKSHIVFCLPLLSSPQAKRASLRLQEVSLHANHAHLFNQFFRESWSQWPPQQAPANGFGPIFEP